MLVELTRRAEADFLRICRYLGPSLAGERLVDAFERQVRNLGQFPEAGVRGHPLAGGARAVFLGDYVMTYEVRGDRIIIRRILHGGRNPKVQR